MKKIIQKTLKNKLFLGFIALVGWNSPFAQTITQNSDITHLGCTTSETNNDYQACIKIGNYLYTGHWGGNLSIGIYNLTNPANPAYITTNELDNSTSNSVYSMVEANGYLYITARYSEKMYVVSYANPTNLQVIGVVNIGMLHGQINIEGNTLYLANDDAKTFEIFNISNPANPVRTSSVSIGTGYSLSVAHKSGIEYCSTSNSNIKVFNVANPSSPVLLTTVLVPNYYPIRVKVIGDYLYTICNPNNNVDPPKLVIFNIGTPSNPIFQNEITVPNVSSLNYINAVGNYLYLGGTTIGVTGAISIYNISNLSSPVIAAQSSSSISRSFNSLAINGMNIYATDKARHELCTYSIANNSLPGAALNFDGYDDQINIGNSLSNVIDPLNTITVEAWVKTTEISSNHHGCIFGNYAYPTDNGQVQLQLRREGANYNFFINDGSGQKAVYAINSVLLNTWQHIAGTWDGSSIKIYINGVLQGTTNGVTGQSLISLNNSFAIGFSLAGNPDEAFKGDIDEVRIWNTARSQSEISTNMNCEILSNSTGLLAAYHFNEGVSENANTAITSLTDATGNFNGTLSDFSLTGTTSNWIAQGAVASDVACAASCPTPTSSITSQSNVLCNGGSDGATTISALGGSSFTYSWAPTGGTAATASGLSAGNYVCSITNNCGNATTQSVIISQPAAIASSQTLTTCDNQPVTVGTHTYSTTGVYTDVLTASNGCDSTVTTNLTVYPTFATSNTITLEVGQSVVIGGISRNTSGVYVTNLTSVQGCDSIVTTTLNMILMWNPLNLVATASSQTQIDLTWADNSAREVGYMIERANSINGTFEQVGFSDVNAISISDLELTLNTNYCYRVAAVDVDGYYSGYTNTSCASTFGAVSIAASNLTATAVSQTGINLTWSDNSSDETGFIIVSEVNGIGFNTIATVAANVTSYSHVGLTQNTLYNYKVIAINQAGNSVSSNIGTALTFDGTPSAATNLVATALSALDIRLTWNDVATNETAYIVQRSLTSVTGFTTIATIPANSTSYSDYEGVNANTTYFYQVLASNIGGSIASNETSALTASTAGYVLTNQNMNCRDAAICMPVISNHTITGAIGFDFTVNYDVTKYSFDGVSINNAMINPTHAEYSTFVNPDGTVKVIVNINGSAPVNASFNGTGSLLCMNFTKNLTNEQGVHQINIGAVLESFSNDAILHSSNNGVVTVTKDTLAAGTLRSWNNNAPLSYNVNTPSQYLITKVYGSNSTGTTQSTNFVTPDINGKYNHNIYDGQYVKIIRDIASSTVMMPYINGTDITMVKQIALGNASFLPNAYQMIAADVNMDGQVTAGDVTLIKQRSTSLIGQFPQMWNATNGQASRDWLFVDSITVANNPSFQRSTTYPAYNGTGFNKNHVPIVGLSLPVAVVYSGNCPAFTASSYRGILLGDINGNFNQTSAGGNKSLDINSMAFELDGAVQQTECIFDIPFYAGSQIGTDVNAIDFDIEFDSTNLEFVDITYATSTETSEQLFNQIATNRVLFTSSDLVAFAPSTLLGYIRFKTTNNEIVPSDLGTIKSYINGEEKSVSVEGSVDCSAQSGVNEVTESKNISIYPNPSKGTFNVDLTSMKGEVTLSVVDFSGKMVKTIITEGGQIAKMDISELSKGIYILHVNTNNSITTYRIVKQ